MGHSSSRSSGSSGPTPNVKEHHGRALYINVPIPLEEALKLCLPPVVPDTFHGSAWLSIVVDDLDSLQARMMGGWMPTGMSGWMTKVNLLVACPESKAQEWTSDAASQEAGATATEAKTTDDAGPTDEDEGENKNENTPMIHAYQILSLHFEDNWGGVVKVQGARATQKSKEIFTILPNAFALQPSPTLLHAAVVHHSYTRGRSRPHGRCIIP